MLALALGGVALAPVGASPLAPARAHAATTAKGPVDRAVALLQSAQRSDGGFGSTVGADASDPVVSTWAALGLEAVGVHPADQPARGTTIRAYLLAHGGELTDTADVARLVMVLRAAGDADTRTATDALARVLERQRPDGGFGDGGAAGTTTTSFALLALAGETSPAARDALARGLTWLKAAATSDGWGPRAGAPAQAGTTGLAMQALHAAEPDEFDLTSAAQSFLNAAGNGDGGLGAADPRTSDVLATAWAMQGLSATGVDPQTYSGIGGATAESYLTRRQSSSGAYGSVLRTAQVLPGINGTPFPLGTVDRGSRLASARAPERKGAAASGGAGGSRALGGATTSGNGAKSAPATTAGGSSATGSTSSGDAGATSGGTASAPGATGSTPSATSTSDDATARAAAAAAKAASDARTDPAKNASAPTSDVDGVVVGARDAAATTAGVAAGGGGSSSSDAATAALAGGLVAVLLIGTQIERRRPRKVLS